MTDWVAYLVAIGILILILYVAFYPLFEEQVHRFWEEIDEILEKIKKKAKGEAEEPW